MSGLIRRLSIGLGLVLASPALALACPVCFSAKNEAARVAFLETTVFLTALPLAMIGGVVYWLLKRAEAAERADEEETQTVTKPARSLEDDTGPSSARALPRRA